MKNNNQNPNIIDQLRTQEPEGTNNNQVPRTNKFASNSNPTKEKKKRFQYTVRDRSGKQANGSFDALSARDVNSFLISQGYQVLSIKEDKFSTSLALPFLSNKNA